MQTTPKTPPMGACRSCGAYGFSQHQPTCKVDVDPPVRFKRGPSRLALRDSLRSAAVRAYLRIQNDLIHGL